MSNPSVQCEDLCNLDPACQAYSYNASALSDNVCFLYKGTGCEVTEGWVTGLKGSWTRLPRAYITHVDLRCMSLSEGSAGELRCAEGTVIDKVVFASYGTPRGTCDRFERGDCHLDETQSIIERCVGHSTCNLTEIVPLLRDPCPDRPKTLRAQVSCRGMYCGCGDCCKT